MNVMAITLRVNEQTGARYLDGCELFGERFQARIDAQGFQHDFACILCGKPTSPTGKSCGVIVTGGGGTVLHPDDDDIEQSDPEGSRGYMGYFPVGSTCVKAIPIEFRVPIERTPWTVIDGRLHYAPSQVQS